MEEEIWETVSKKINVWKYQNGKGEKNINISHRWKETNLLAMWNSLTINSGWREWNDEVSRRRKDETKPHKIKYGNPFGFRRVCSHWAAVYSVTPTDINSNHLINVLLESSWIQNIITFVYIMACDLFHMYGVLLHFGVALDAWSDSLCVVDVPSLECP